MELVIYCFIPLLPLVLSVMTLKGMKVSKLAILVAVGYFIFWGWTWYSIGFGKIESKFLINEEVMFSFQKEGGFKQNYENILHAILSGQNVFVGYPGGWIDSGQYVKLFAFSRDLKLSRLVIGQLGAELNAKEEGRVFWRHDVLFTPLPEGIAKYMSSWRLLLYYGWMFVISYFLLMLALSQSRVPEIVLLVAMCAFFGIIAYSLYMDNTFSWHASPGKAVDKLILHENIEKLDSLSALPTRILEANNPETLIGHQLLCGGNDFFVDNFLCWRLGKFSYLYYFPQEIKKPSILSSQAQITHIDSHFFFVEYPNYITANNLRACIYYLYMCLLLIASGIVYWRVKNRIRIQVTDATLFELKRDQE